VGLAVGLALGNAEALADGEGAIDSATEAAALAGVPEPEHAANSRQSTARPVSGRRTDIGQSPRVRWRCRQASPTAVPFKARSGYAAD
jgi:hypothetical protein